MADLHAVEAAADAGCPGGRAVTGTTRPLRLGTRRSPLALAQSRLVAAAVAAAGRSARSSSSRSRRRATSRPAPLTAASAAPACSSSALREALLAGEVDLAVHSLKDLPDRAAPTGSPSPRCRRGRTPATCSWPATA